MSKIEAAARQALEALDEFISEELLVGQRYTNEGQKLLDSYIALREAAEQQAAEPLSFNCSAGCGACGVKLQDFVTHQTQAQEGDEWVVVDAEPQIVSACCGSPVEVWDERKKDIVARVEAAQQQAQPTQQPLTDEQIDAIWDAVITPSNHIREFVRAVEAAHGITGSKP